MGYSVAVSSPASRTKPEGKRARNRRERTEALVNAGLELFLERGVEVVTIDELAKAAGMAKGNFYRYFDDKRALVDAILAPIASDVRTAMRRCAVTLGRADAGTDLNAVYAALALELAGVTLPRLKVAQFYLQENRSPPTPSTEGIRALALEMSQGAIHLTDVAVSHDLLRVSDPRVSALAVVGAVEQLALAVLRGELDAHGDEIARIVVSMVLDGIRAR
ncbi:MAG: TetR family transcriptional regulator [Sandaracinus sp.]|nr:TetR family transcriptional regulator [Sandaracinus sp.]|tara:strand:+ start:5336 stop:5995 length:660 start_codon:yes stop_codon:yes gene_type:complete